MEVEYVRRAPAPALREFVDDYVGYRLEGGPPGEHRGLPSRRLTLVVPFDRPVLVAADGAAPAAFDALVGGLHDRAVRLPHDGNQRGLQLALRPRAAAALFGVPAGELGGQVLRLEDVAGPWAARTAERLASAAGWAERFDVLDEELARAVRPVPPPAPEIRQAWARLVRSGGTVPVTGLAAEVGWSRRHLAERFRREVGLSPKAAARVLRFERARDLLLRGPVRLADVAARCGYTDQAHLAREWRDLVGCPPSVWLREEAPFAAPRGDAGAA